MISRTDITGLILAGGLGTRMGGIDKGLQSFRDQPLARHALQHLASQVGPLMVNANRHLESYATWGVPVWPDAIPGHPGPLAGFLAGLEHCQTEWLASVPCDAPLFPTDLVARLAAAIEARPAASIAIAATHDGSAERLEPVFCLMRRALAPALRAHLQSGGRRHVGDWATSLGAVKVRFDDVAAFANVNTLADLHELDGLKADA